MAEDASMTSIGQIVMEVMFGQRPFMRLWLKTPAVALCDAVFDINDLTHDDLDQLKRDLADTRAKAAAEQ